jgi:hypothetical protein
MFFWYYPVEGGPLSLTVSERRPVNRYDWNIKSSVRSSFVVETNCATLLMEQYSRFGSAERSEVFPSLELTGL